MAMRVKVTFEATLPVDATLEQADEWIKFEIGASGALWDVNPLSEHSLEADYSTVWVEQS